MPTENSSPNSVAPQNVAYFSDGNILRDLGRLEARIDAHDKEFEKLNELSKEVSKLKEWRAYLLGGVAVVGLAVTSFMKIFS